MNILFLNPPFGHERPEGLDAPVGIMYLSSVLKNKGYTCYFVDNVWEKQGDWSKWESALKTQVAIVLIHTHIRFSEDTKEAVKILKDKYNPVISIGFGPQASTEPKRLIQEMKFDACVIGEPENLVPEIIKEIEVTGNPLDYKPAPRAGLATITNLKPGTAQRVDVDRLPFPDWKFVSYDRYIEATNNAVVMSSRGYDKGDAFNQPPLIYAATPTYRCSIERIINELKLLRKEFPGTYTILFHDEVFTEDRSWVIQLCKQLKNLKFGIPYWCFTRADMIDKELCAIMKEAGFVGLSMGMESASDRILKILKRDLSKVQIENGFKIAQKSGMLTVGSVMIGTPGDSEGDHDETWDEIVSSVKMVQKIHPDILTVTITTALPGTQLYNTSSNKILAELNEESNIYHLWEGKYPIKLNTLTARDISEAASLIKSTWKKRLWKSLFRMSKLVLKSSSFRKTIFMQIIKVAKRKIIKR